MGGYADPSVQQLRTFALELPLDFVMVLYEYHITNRTGTLMVNHLDGEIQNCDLREHRPIRSRAIRSLKPNS